MKKAHNKFIFDKSWYEEIIKLEEDHYKQMAIILAFGAKHQPEQDESDILREDPMSTKDPKFGVELVHQHIKEAESMSDESVQMLVSKYKTEYVQPPKHYLIKL